MPIVVKTAGGLKKVTKVLTKTASGLEEITAITGKQGGAGMKVYTNSPWKKLGNLPEASSAGRPALFVLNGNIYLYGGYSKVGTVRINSYKLYKYNVPTDTWTLQNLGSSLLQIDSPVVGVIDNAAYIIGTVFGQGGVTMMRLTETSGVIGIESANLSNATYNQNSWVHVYNGSAGLGTTLTFPGNGSVNESWTIMRADTPAQAFAAKNANSSGISDDYPGYATDPANSGMFILIGGERINELDQWTVSRKYDWQGGLLVSNGIPEGRSQQAFASSPTNFYMFGGTHREPGGDGEYFPKKDLWKFNYNMLQPEITDDFPGDPIRLASAIILDNFMYIVGGMVDDATVPSVYRYKL